MNRWAPGTKEKVPDLINHTCFSGLAGVNSKETPFAYYEIQKMLDDTINDWYLKMARSLFVFKVLENNKDSILIKVPLTKKYIVNLARMTFLRYLDKNELANTPIKNITLKAFELKDKIPDIHALLIAHYIYNGTEGCGHYVTKTPTGLWYGKKYFQNLLTIEQLKTNLSSRSTRGSVFDIFGGDNPVRSINNNESPEDYYLYLKENLCTLGGE